MKSKTKKSVNTSPRIALDKMKRRNLLKVKRKWNGLIIQRYRARNTQVAANMLQACCLATNKSIFSSVLKSAASCAQA